MNMKKLMKGLKKQKKTTGKILKSTKKSVARVCANKLYGKIIRNMLIFLMVVFYIAPFKKCSGADDTICNFQYIFIGCVLGTLGMAQAWYYTKKHTKKEKKVITPETFEFDF